ncbi:MAG: hypothetical protein Q7S39_12325 [Ignavibacteria bacterium]|nr:hypothetical protein [Ignavibacteria bacterium]
MHSNEILKHVKESIHEDNWFMDTNVSFHDVYFNPSIDAIPFELLLNGENIIEQIRRKYFFVFNSLAEIIAKEIQEENGLSTKPIIWTVVDADYEYSTRVFLIWDDHDLILTKYFTPATYFYFKNETEMKSFLLKKYHEGIKTARFYLQRFPHLIV